MTEKKKMDPVDPKANQKDFDERKDQDIDNDGDVDKTDKYLHRRRKAVTKAVKGEAKKNGKKDQVETEPSLDNEVGVNEAKEFDKNAAFRDLNRLSMQLKSNPNMSQDKKNDIYRKMNSIKSKMKHHGVMEADGVAPEAVDKHNCATHVYHEQFGEGQPIYSMHADPDEFGLIEWYDVMFEHGIEKKVPTSEMKVTKEMSHGNHKKKK
jgi:hypothetical protein